MSACDRAVVVVEFNLDAEALHETVTALREFFEGREQDPPRWVHAAIGPVADRVMSPFDEETR